MMAAERSLLDRFPWFAHNAIPDSPRHPRVCEQFGGSLCRGISDGSLSDTEVDRAFRYLNELGASAATDQFAIAILTAVFTVILRHENVVSMARTKLDGSALRALEETEECNRVTRTLCDQFPGILEPDEMKDPAQFEEIGNYGIAYRFGAYVCEGVSRNLLDGDEVGRAFSCLNQLGEAAEGNLQLANLLTVGILETLTDTEQSIKVARQKLNGNAAGLLEEVIDFFKVPWA